MSGYVKTPTVYQFEATECGAASLSMIFSYYGKYMPLTQLRVETGVSRDGCNAGNIMRCAKKYGLECKGYRKPFSALKSIKLPCIIHWDENHFVVFEGFRGKYAFVNDPAAGRRKMTASELEEGFSGTVLTFETTDKFIKDKKKYPVADYVKSAVKENKLQFFLYFLISALLAAPTVVLPLLTGALADAVSGNNSIDAFSVEVFTASIFLIFILLIFSERALRRLKKRLILISSKKLLHKLFRLPVTFYEQRYTGDISGSAVCPSDVYTFITDNLFFSLSEGISSLACLALLAVYSPVLAIIALLSIIPYVAVARICSASLADASVRYRQDSGILRGKLIAGLGITDTIKASGAEKGYTEAVIGQYERAEYSREKLIRIKSISDILFTAVKIFFGAVMFFVCLHFFYKGEFTVGGVLCSLILFVIFSRPVNSVAGLSGVINSVRAEVCRIEDIEAYPCDDKYVPCEKKNINTKLEGSVELKGVSFGYSAFKPPVISGLSFSVGCGSSIALVGMSGSGKSTAAKIISGLYKPQTGEILFDEIPSDEIPSDVISASISTVSQKITLFSGTVRDNLTMWNSSISEADMIAAAKDACIHELISEKAEGYDFVLTKGAQNLSGGQRQRLEIARALAINPTVLIMDEATSALDPITEKNILDNIKRRGCTCIVIAHRLSAIRDCDMIAVMDKGRIVQTGTHKELCRTDGIYRSFIAEE